MESIVDLNMLFDYLFVIVGTPIINMFISIIVVSLSLFVALYHPIKYKLISLVSIILGIGICLFFRQYIAHGYSVGMICGLFIFTYGCVSIGNRK